MRKETDMTPDLSELAVDPPPGEQVAAAQCYLLHRGKLCVVIRGATNRDRKVEESNPCHCYLKTVFEEFD